MFKYFFAANIGRSLKHITVYADDYATAKEEAISRLNEHDMASDLELQDWRIVLVSVIDREARKKLPYLEIIRLSEPTPI